MRTKLADQSWDVNQTDIHGLSALHIAVMCRNYEMVNVLLNRKASLMKIGYNPIGDHDFK